MFTPTGTLLAPTASATLTETPTALPPEPPLTLLLTDTFDAGELYLWTLGAGWSLAASEGGLALQVTNSDAPVTFVHNTLEDAAVQARFLLSSGMARMSLRQSEAGSYTALLDAGGQVALYRGGQVMGAATVTPAVPGVWRTLRLSAIGDIVRVAVDGVEVIAARDPAPLPAGTLSFASVGQNALVVDDVAIWRSSSADMAAMDEPTWLYECDFRASQGGWTSVPTGYTSTWIAGEGWRGVYDPQIPFIRKSVDNNTNYRITGGSVYYTLASGAGSTGYLTLDDGDGVSPYIDSAQPFPASAGGAYGACCFGWTNWGSATGYNNVGLVIVGARTIYGSPQYIRAVRFSGTGINPFGVEDCNGAPPTDTPTPTLTNTPTLTPTATSTPPWSEDGIVQIDFNDPIPPLQGDYTPCKNNGTYAERISCANRALNEYRSQLGGDITWGQFASLLMYAEGNYLLKGDDSSGILVLGNPQSAGLGTCWRYIGNDIFDDGADQCDRPSEAWYTGYQSDFIYAVWEYIFNYCAKGVGYTSYMKNNVPYNGECNENGFANVLYYANSLYADTTYTFNPILYLTRAEEEFVKWGWHNGEVRRYRYGICPCGWEGNNYLNPAAIPPDQVGLIPPELTAQRNKLFSVNGGHSFSYFAHINPKFPWKYSKVY